MVNFRLKMVLNFLWALMNLSTVLSIYRVPIIYVFTVVPNACKHGFPEYIRVSLDQAVHSQPDAQIILASNFADCETIAEMTVPNVLKIDSSLIMSNRTRLFTKLATDMFQQDNGSELWMTSALRFFIMEDIMIAYKYPEMIHVEADNLLYGNMTNLLPVLRESYNGLAATPLNAELSFITASVFWIANLESLLSFNDLLLRLGDRGPDDTISQTGAFKQYLLWLRPFACCKRGGIDQDSEGNGIKPFAVNEMSMLAYYHHLHPTVFKLFPVVPTYEYYSNRYVCNMSEFGPNGHSVGAPTGDGVWDPNSWGQYLGGTHYKKGRDKKFTDPSHVIGQAIRVNPSCVAEMLCANESYSATFGPFIDYSTHKSSSNDMSGVGDVRGIKRGQTEEVEKKCFTAPFARCGLDNERVWTPLWNLHVHSKHTHNFRSLPCQCQSQIAMENTRYLRY